MEDPREGHPDMRLHANGLGLGMDKDMFRDLTPSARGIVTPPASMKELRRTGLRGQHCGEDIRQLCGSIWDCQARRNRLREIKEDRGCHQSCWWPHQPHNAAELEGHGRTGPGRTSYGSRVGHGGGPGQSWTTRGSQEGRAGAERLPVLSNEHQVEVGLQWVTLQRAQAGHWWVTLPAWGGQSNRYQWGFSALRSV